jgi:hypothetical protein
MFEQDLDAAQVDLDRTSDACGQPATFSSGRFLIFLPIFLTMMPGSAVLFICFGDMTYGIQFASIIAYTAATILYTFSANRGMQRYLFSCPYVRSQLPRVAIRHIAFLAALFILITAALQVRPHLSHWWLAPIGPRGTPPLIDGVFILCGSLLLTEIMTNRSLLKRAHAVPDDLSQSNNGSVPT